jgi:membrane protease subunit HflK
MNRWLILSAIVVVLLVVTVASAVTEIKPGERGVVRRFGRIIATPGPGLYIGLPWGIDRVDRERIGRERRATVGFDAAKGEDETKVPEGLLLTGDHNLINIQIVIGYTLEEEEVARFVVNADRVDALIARAAEAALAQWNAGRAVDDVLLFARGALPDNLPPWMVRELAQRLAPYELGIRIKKVDVTLLDPPMEVKSAFDAVAQAKTEINTRVNQAEQEAAGRLRAAEATIFRSERQTAAYRNEQLLQARAEADNFVKRLEQYRLNQDNPQYLAGIWWDEVSRLFGKMRQNGRLDLLDHHLGPNGLDITQIPALPKKN